LSLLALMMRAAPPPQQQRRCVRVELTQLAVCLLLLPLVLLLQQLLLPRLHASFVHLHGPNTAVHG
jgi:hypothetical protein